MGVFPADHVIGKPREYVRLLKPAFKAARAGKIVVLGIQPRWAETGYGYIEFPEGVAARRCRVAAGEAVPREARRRDGRHVFSKPATSIGTRHVLLEDFGAAGRAAAASAQDRDAARQPAAPSAAASLPRAWQRRFRKCENISIDYAVLERAAERRRACRPAISAGTTSEAGTPCTSCTRATGRAMRCARTRMIEDEHRQLRRCREEAGRAAGRKGSDRRRHARRAADRRPQPRAGGGRAGEAARKSRPPSPAVITGGGGTGRYVY